MEDLIYVHHHSWGKSCNFAARDATTYFVVSNHISRKMLAARVKKGCGETRASTSETATLSSQQ
jgi:hypothetical protein